ncbi:hypothetical protein [Bacteroides uniformis]|uniref:hypothetical protein n=1 Tax=Bacteroides uniformis TaxID=820 RepID=UPI00203091CC|nr:hypothetical protein [Bacteroides uniformis]MCM1730915.1 hypothetical protein [Bacteroides uniformis]MCM1929477.1 hypothetical protein [Bacteroides uniformis]MCM1932983.1 hypothetical protein [Bacteroides uniformis]
MKSEQVLSIEQMKHLQELGLDVSDESIYWVRRAHGSKIDDESKGKWGLSLQKDFIVYGFTSYEIIPTYTLQDILNQLPKCIEMEDYEFDLNIYYHENGVSIFYDDGDVEQLAFFSEPTILESAYKMLCWCIENGYIGKECGQ